MSQYPAPASIWGTLITVAVNPARLDIGDLRLTVAKLPHEWQLHYHWQTPANGGRFNCQYLDEPVDPAQVVNRIAMEKMSDAVSLLPRLADLPVVVRPYAPLVIPANNRITLYVTTPLWLCLQFDESVRRELPVQQLSETWMGPKSSEGELCYGSHTHARLDRDMLINVPWRALTPININNTSDVDFTLERLSIPTPYLSLFYLEDRLSTEVLNITMDSSRHQGIVEIEDMRDQERISAPRRTAARGILVSAWDNLFA